jgi:hypothetical protein
MKYPAHLNSLKTAPPFVWGLLVIAIAIVHVVDWRLTTPITITPKSNSAPVQDLNQTVPPGVPMARAFPVWNRSSIPYNWCHKDEGTTSGILFVKVDKCASTTGSGATIRIADKLGNRLMGEFCVTRHKHGWASAAKQGYLSRDADRSMLWTIVRHPASRILSAFFFFEVSRNGVNATEATILDFVGKPRYKAQIVDYLKLKAFQTKKEEIQHVIQNYDFIAVAERMAESLAVMSMLMKVPLADLIVLSAKADGYDDGLSAKGCVKLTRAWRTPKVDEYLARDFLQDNHDIILYQAVNESIDLTIDALGRDKVMAKVDDYHALVAKNKRECAHEAIFPCPLTRPNHTILSRQDCYYSDAGCGHRCTDKALRAESDDEWKRLTMPR